MDDKILKSFTKALDISITKVAKLRFAELSSQLNSQQIALQVLRSLRSFERLQRGAMPEYNAWDALFYSIWYQPGHINLAYTLVKKVPKEKNPFTDRSGKLFVRILAVENSQCSLAWHWQLLIHIEADCLFLKSLFFLRIAVHKCLLLDNEFGLLF